MSDAKLAPAKRAYVRWSVVLAVMLLAVFGAAPLLRALRLADYDEPLGWRLAGVDGRVLTLESAEGDCLRFDRAKIDESAETVTIALVGRVDVGRPSCLADERFHCRIFTLAAPLGSRTLWHAPAPGAGRTLDSASRAPALREGPGALVTPGGCAYREPGDFTR